MPKPRGKENRGLPKRWQHTHGAYYYRVPAGDEDRWGGKRRFRLGATLPEAYKTWGERFGKVDAIRTLDHAFDRYVLEVVPAKGVKTQTSNGYALKRLRPVFGGMPITALKPHHVYQYFDRRTHKTAAHREIEVLSHVYTKLVEWGMLTAHPFKNEVRLDGARALKARTRYVDDWEIIECLNLAPFRKKGSVLMCQAYIRLKLLTGLSQGDMLRLRVGDHLREDGIHVQRHKTKDTTGKRTVYEYSKVPERKAAVEEAIRARPALSPFLFCNRRGEGYLNEATGNASGFKSMWQHFMTRVLKETTVSEHFTEHDLRAKAGSDAESLEKARALLQHANVSTTLAIYRRKPERV